MLGRSARARRRPSARTVVAVAAAVVLIAAGALWWWQRDTPAEAAQRYLRAQWSGQWVEQCDLATLSWRQVIYNGYPFADCDAYAAAARKADRADAAGASSPSAGAPSTLAGFAAYRADTEVDVRVEELSSGDGRARIAYVVALQYRGDDRAGFDALWQGAPAEDRGTVEMVDDEGWRVAGVDSQG
ncbi:hypothetical protein [Aeromicrobium sp.]|uniref:hypothetical protein n=1 Tax=Aeromicrobium sp. TaxID=1871063 RepID=UPI00351656FE